VKIKPPVETSQTELTLELADIEGVLQGPAMKLDPWPDAYITLKDGRKMMIRQATLADVPMMLEHMKRVMEVKKDFYDIVGVRIYAEILGWATKRLKDPFHLIGTIDGVWAGLANGRVMTKDVAISLHTMTFARGGRIGYVMYYAKTMYALEIAKCAEWWSTFESYAGWRLGAIDFAQPSYPWPQYQHELGGSRVYYCTQEYWHNTLKDYTLKMIGADISFDVPDEVRKANEVFKLPTELAI
jgi:hypothetical protein